MLLKHYVEFSKLARLILVHTLKNVAILFYAIFKTSYNAYFENTMIYLVLYSPLRLLFFRGFDQHSYRFRLDLDLTDVEACK